MKCMSQREGMNSARPKAISLSFSIFLFPFFLGLWGGQWAIGQECLPLPNLVEKVLSKLYEQDPEKFPSMPEKRAFETWLRWEEKMNRPVFTQSTDLVPLHMVAFPSNEVEVFFAGDVPLSMQEQFVDKAKGKVYVPVHPHAKDEEILGVKELKRSLHTSYPHQDIQSRKVRKTASRSLILFDQNDKKPLFSIKLPTDHLVDPHSPQFQKIWHHQPEKAHEGTYAWLGFNRSNYIQQIDQQLGPDPQVEILREVGAIVHRPTGEGFSIRDISPLQDGHYYLPGLSVPYVGQKLAQLHGQDFSTYWGQHFARALGQAKAKILLRYNLQYFTPNPQNFLLQLDPQTLRPTGKVIFRDVSDTRVTQLDQHWVPAIEGREFAQQNGLTVDMALHPYWENSILHFDDKINWDTLKEWEKKHNMAYAKEVADALDIPLTQLLKKSPSYLEQITFHSMVQNQKMKYTTVGMGEETRISMAIQEYLQSPEGQEKWRQYRERLKERLKNGKNGKKEASICPHPSLELDLSTVGEACR